MTFVVTIYRELPLYKDDFNQYANQRIFECLPEFGPVSHTDHGDISVKVDSHYDLQRLKSFVINSYVFHQKAFSVSVE